MKMNGQKARLFIVSGPSGSGKTTLCNHVLGLKAFKCSLVKSVSVTTRRLRGRECPKKDYTFVSTQRFQALRKRGAFLEYQNVFGSWYGTPKQFVDRALKSGRSVILCIDVKGAMVVRKLRPESVMVFILPPSMAVLKKRLTNRLTEGTKERYVRLRIARREMAYARHYDYCIVNDDLATATKQLEAIVIAEQCRR